MGIYNSIDEKKDEFTQTEENQIDEPKSNSKVKTNEFVLQEVKEIKLEYISKETESIIQKYNKMFEIVEKMAQILKMGDKSENKKKEINIDEKNIASIHNIKSKYIFKKIFNNINKMKFFRIIKYNKKLQKILNIDENDYRKFCEIEIELIPILNQHGKFINFHKKEDKSYFHIYFDDNKEEIKRNFLIKNENISKINIIIDYQIKSLDYLFSDCQCIKLITFKKFNRKKIDSMECMFNNCSSLIEINLSNFNTEDVTRMNEMFRNCKLLEELNLSKFDTKNVVSMHQIFKGCSSLTELNLSNFNTMKVTDMSCMFNDCSSLEKLNLSNFKTNKLEYINSMFSGCSSLKEINLSNFNTKNVINMDYIFNRCSSLKEINLSNFITDNIITMCNIFSDCSSLKEIDISNFNTENVTDMSDMFSGCAALKKINLLNFKTKNLTKANRMFYGCLSLEDINLSNFNLNDIVEVESMFKGCSNGLIKKLKNEYKIKRDEVFD